jgi:Gas vesicle synthesis protein GvpL/GvpF
MRLYVYCLSDELDAGSVEGLEGVGGGRVCLFDAGGVFVVVSEFEGERAAVTRENLRAHNRVNAHVLARSTPLPFRFGTLSDGARLEAYAASNARPLAEGLARVRGRVEMSVKVRLGAGAAAEESGVNTKESGVNAEESGVNDEESGAAWKAHAGSGGRGTAFLLAKRREILGDEALKARAEEVATSLAACVEGLARESDVRVSPEGPIVLRASHLIERADVSEYRVRVRDLGAGLGGLLTLTSGPWPPYSFTNFSPV